MMTLNSLKSFLTAHLLERIIPFWLERGIDRDNGGFFTCFNNSGDSLVSRDKYVWSQGRFLWVLSHLYRYFKDLLGPANAERIERGAKSGAVFLKNSAILDDGTCAWLVNERGIPVEYKNGVSNRGDITRHPAHLGIEADEFLIYGFVEFSIAFDRREFFRLASDIYTSVVERIDNNVFFSAPYGVPVGYKSHGIPMLLLETTREMIVGANYWKDSSLVKLLEIGRRVLEQSLYPFKCNKRRVVFEMVKDNGDFAPDEMIGSYYNPGHTLEHAWFLIDFAREVERVFLSKFAGVNLILDSEHFDSTQWINEGITLIDWIMEKAWDGKFGGIPQFLHVDWGKPRGKVLKENLEDKLIRYLENHWDKKLWWVHSEALYALLLAYKMTGKEDYWDYYTRMHEYTFNTFPNKNGEIGEWVQIRNRNGDPVEETVALPVKDPFHIPRALMFMVELL